MKRRTARGSPWQQAKSLHPYPCLNRRLSLPTGVGSGKSMLLPVFHELTLLLAGYPLG